MTTAASVRDPPILHHDRLELDPAPLYQLFAGSSGPGGEALAPPAGVASHAPPETRLKAASAAEKAAHTSNVNSGE